VKQKKKAKVTPAPAIAAPAVHPDALWDNPGVLENLDSTPIDSRDWTKSRYFDELNKRGLRMKHQQESSTGPERELPVEIPLEFQPTKAPDPLTPDEARLFGAMKAFFQLYGLAEDLRCAQCFTRKRPTGTRVSVRDRGVSVTCRCGTAKYTPPTGTTDMVLTRFANTAGTMLDRTMGDVTLQTGDHLAVPTIVLDRRIAALVQEYAKMLHRRGYEPHWYHRGGCWDGVTLGEEQETGLMVSATDIAIICKCRMLYAKTATTH
jgi:hypothetical protein